MTDVRNNKCDEAYAYIADVLRYGIVVYSWKEDKSWRISHNFFYPDPIACRYKLDNITFRFVIFLLFVFLLSFLFLRPFQQLLYEVIYGLSRWTDGIFGMALSPLNPETNDRLLYFHPMSSFREFSVPTSILRNASADDHPEEFKVCLAILHFKPYNQIFEFYIQKKRK